MKKAQLFIILLVVMALLALADYKVTSPAGLILPKQPEVLQVEQPEEEVPAPSVTEVVPKNHFNVTQSVLDTDERLTSYELQKRTRTQALFETFDLSQMTNLASYRNVIVEAESKAPIYVYEVHGPVGQGQVNFLNIKLAMVGQLGSDEQINETNDYGKGSLFYNDPSAPTTGFLLVQIGDNIFGFQYSKSSETAFAAIQNFVSTYQSLINS